MREAIVNAIVHRDYTSSAAVQVSVFADRIEVWNPGHLLPPLTPENLRQPHRSILRNPRIAEVLFLARYIEKYGTGILMMIRESISHSLPEPGFQQHADEFAATVWRDWLTEEVVDQLGLNDRQKTAMARLKQERLITTMVYERFVGCSHRTAARDLEDLFNKGILRREGAGRSAHYLLATHRVINVPNVPLGPSCAFRSNRPPIPG